MDKMRLFQSHLQLEASVEPVPSFLRDPTREHLKTMVHYRDTRHRLPTPDKVAIMELSHSFEKRRLGKQQQILSEMNQRCREQEISDMSSKLSAKCNLSPSENKMKEMTFYSTNMVPRTRQKTYLGTIEVPEQATLPHDKVQNGAHEKTYKHFPARRVIKNQGKFEFVKSPIHFDKPPRVSPVLLRNPNPLHSSHESLLKARLMPGQRINGAVQMELYTPRGDMLAPLSLPQIDPSHHVDTHVDSISASRVQLGSRNITTFGHDSNLSNSTRTNKSRSYNTKSLKHKDGALKTEKSEMHLTNVDKSGNSPPPNSTELNPGMDGDEV